LFVIRTDESRDHLPSLRHHFGTAKEHQVNRDQVTGIAIGVGIGLVAPMVFPSMARMVRPGVNAAIRAGIVAWERGREQMAEWGEYAEDMMAEARAQPAAHRPPPNGGPASGPIGGNGEAPHA
jgi:hypothetical protein